MLFLRMLSLFAAGFVLFASPFFLLSQRQALDGGWALALGALAVAAFAGGYLFFALLAHRFARSARLRTAGAGVIAFQIAAGAVVLATSDNPQALIATAPVLCCSVGLMLAFVWPGAAARNHRPMRRRERTDHFLAR